MSITKYLKETRSELRNVKWPTRRYTILFTALVIVVSLAVAYLLGLFDVIFTAGISKLIIK